jgi:hypothetical protein
VARAKRETGWSRRVIRHVNVSITDVLSDYALRANPTYLLSSRKKQATRRASLRFYSEKRQFRFSLQPLAFSLARPAFSLHPSAFKKYLYSKSCLYLSTASKSATIRNVTAEAYRAGREG